MNTENMTGRFDDTEVEIDLVDLIMEVLRRWIWIVVAIIVVAAAAYVGTKRQETSEHTSTAVLYLNSSEDMDKDTESYLIGDCTQVVTGRAVMEQVSEDLGLGLTYSQLSGKVSVSNPSSSRMLNITVTYSDPEMAKEIADGIAELSSEYIGEMLSIENPKIVQYGYVNQTPVNGSSAKKNAMMGGAVGAVLAIILIIIIYLARDLVETPEDMARKTGLNVLGAVPEGGAQDESMRVFKANLSLVGDGVKSILFTGVNMKKRRFRKRYKGYC